MNLTDQELEHLEAYAEGRLSAKEKALIDARIEKDAAFREEASLFLHTYQQLEYARFSTHAAWLGQPPEEKKIRPRSKKYIIIFVLLISIILLLFYYRYDRKSRSIILDSSSPPMAQVNIEHFPRLGNTMGVVNTTRRDSGLNLYEARSYRDAIIKLEQIIRDNPGDEEVKFYLSICYMTQEEWTKAEVLLESIKESKIRQKEAIPWYLARCKYMNNKISEAIPLFEKIKNGNDPALAEKADSILKEIKKINN